MLYPEKLCLEASSSGTTKLRLSGCDPSSPLQNWNFAQYSQIGVGFSPTSVLNKAQDFESHAQHIRSQLGITST